MADEAEEVQEEAKPAEPAVEETDAERAEIEARARKLGWVAPEEWDEERAEREGRRKPSRFMSAEDYVRRTEENLPVLRGTLRRLESQVDELRREQRESNELIRFQHEQSVKAKRTAYEQGIRDAEAKMEKAVSDADTDTFRQARADRDKLLLQAQNEQPRPQAQPQPGIPAHHLTAAQVWARDNDWFRNDPELREAMKDTHAKVIEEMGVERGNSYQGFEEAKRRVMDKFPDDFEDKANSRRKAPRTVVPPSGGERKPANGAAAKFAQLSAEEKAAFERHRKRFKDTMGHDYTVEQFMEHYGS